MNLLQQILGGGQQQDYQDFVNRYEQGPPYQGVSHDEALNRYQQIAPHLPPNAYEQAAQQSFSQLTPQQRVQLGQYLIQSAQQQGVNLPAVNQLQQGGGGANLGSLLQDTGFLAQLVGGMHQQQPGLVSQLLGAAMSGGMGGMSGGQASGGQANMLDSPIAKAALAGIAAMAAKQFLGNR